MFIIYSMPKRGIDAVLGYKAKGAKIRKLTVSVPRPVRRSLNYNNAVSRLTRSGYFDIGINCSSQNEFGVGVNSTGLLYTINSGTVTSQTWAGATDISNTFDAYRIMGFRIIITFNQDISNVTGTAETLPYLYMAKDYDDINSNAISPNELLQRPDCTQISLGRPKSTGSDYSGWVVPKCAPLAYASSAASGYMEPKPFQWVSTSPGIAGTFYDCQHYGIKGYVDASKMTQSASQSLGNMRIYVKCYFECKHPY